MKNSDIAKETAISEQEIMQNLKKVKNNYFKLCMSRVSSCSKIENTKNQNDHISFYLHEITRSLNYLIERGIDVFDDKNLNNRARLRKSKEDYLVKEDNIPYLKKVAELDDFYFSMIINMAESYIIDQKIKDSLLMHSYFAYIVNVMKTLENNWGCSIFREKKDDFNPTKRIR